MLRWHGDSEPLTIGIDALRKPRLHDPTRRGTYAPTIGCIVANAKKDGISDGIVTLGKPKHVDVNGDRAYVVIPTDYTYKQNGKPMKETKSAFAFALHKGAEGWTDTVDAARIIYAEDALMQYRYASVSAIVFGVVALIQAIRAFNEWPVQIGPYAIPVWFSWLAVLVAGALCVWGFRSARR